MPTASAILQHDLICIFSLSFYHSKGTQASCRAVQRPALQNFPQTPRRQGQNVPQQLRSDYEQTPARATATRFCLRVLKMKGASGFTGFARAARRHQRQTGLPGEARSTNSWRRAEQGGWLRCLGGEPGMMLNHRSTLLISCIPPGAQRALV